MTEKITNPLMRHAEPDGHPSSAVVHIYARRGGTRTSPASPMETAHVNAAPPRVVGNTRLPIRRRLILLVALSALGGVLFVPFTTTGSAPSISPWLIFPIASAVVVALSAWGGLLAADKIDLPMPILRGWERGEPADLAQLARNVRFAVLVGVPASLIMLGISTAFGIPKNPGSLLVRLLTTPFAAVVTETFAHLFVLSVLALWLKSRWVAIVLSSLIFTAVFHGQAFGSLDITLVALALNFLFFALTGWVYVRQGFLAGMLTHAVAQLVMLGIN